MPEMQFASFAEFLSMGGYGFYVWLAYAAFMVFLVANVVQPMLRRRQVEKIARRYAQFNEPSAPETGAEDSGVVES